jgi:hypothetical protein
VEHVEKNDKPMLYLVFEYMDTDLKKYIDLHGRGRTGSPLEAKVIQVVLPSPFCLHLQHKGLMQKKSLQRSLFLCSFCIETSCSNFLVQEGGNLMLCL